MQVVFRSFLADTNYYEMVVSIRIAALVLVKQCLSENLEIGPFQQLVALD